MHTAAGFPANGLAGESVHLRDGDAHILFSVAEAASPAGAHYCFISFRSTIQSRSRSGQVATGRRDGRIPTPCAPLA